MAFAAPAGVFLLLSSYSVGSARGYVKSTLDFVDAATHALSQKGARVAHEEEVRRVAEAIDALGQMSDTMARAKALTELLDQWPDHHSRIREMRQQAVRALNEEGMTYRQIAAELGISVARVGQIVTGVTNPRTQKKPPPKKTKQRRGEAGDEPTE